MKATLIAAASLATTASWAAVLLRWPGRRLVATNYRGRPAPAVLGVAAALGAATGGGIVLWVDAIGGTGRAVPGGMGGVTAGAVVVVLAGLADDLAAGGPRGLRSHLRALLEGRVTTGLLKAAALVGGAALAVVALGGRPWPAMAVGVVVLAGAGNLWNGLDTVPARAIKAFLPVCAALLTAGPGGAPRLLLLALLGAAVAVGPVDLRERAMLGDAGSNLLGFVVGLGMYAVLPTWGLAVAAAAVVALNVAGEIVTLTRLIEGAPPLRWADRVGRLPP